MIRATSSRGGCGLTRLFLEGENNTYTYTYTNKHVPLYHNNKLVFLSKFKRPEDTLFKANDLNFKSHDTSVAAPTVSDAYLR